MSDTEIKTMKCENCGHVFALNTQDVIDGTNLELKKSILDLSYFTLKCDKCGNEHLLTDGFTYFDESKQFGVVYDNYANLLYIDNEFKKEQERLRAEGEDAEMEPLISAPTPFGVVTVINAYDFGLDWRVCSLFVLSLAEKRAIEIRAHDKTNVSVFWSYLSDERYENGDYKLKVLFSNDDNFFQEEIAFSKELYDKFYSKTIGKINRVNPFCFDGVIVSNYLRTLNLDLDEILDKKFPIFAVKTPSFKRFLCNAQTYLEEQIKLGDTVMITLETGEKLMVEVDGIFFKSSLEFPSQLICDGYIDYKIKPQIYKQVWPNKNNEGETFLKKYNKWNSTEHPQFKDFPFDEMLDSTFYVCEASNIDTVGEEIPVTIKTDKANQRDFILERVYRRDLKHLAVYTSLDKVPTDDMLNIACLKTEDIFRIIKNDSSYEGIVFNPDQDNVDIVRLEIEQFILNKCYHFYPLFRETISSLSEKEIEFVDKYNYDLARNLFINHISDEKMAELLNIPLEEITPLIRIAVDRIKTIYLSKF